MLERRCETTGTCRQSKKRRLDPPGRKNVGCCDPGDSDVTAVKTGRKAARAFFDVFDELPRSPAATAFERVVERRISRRGT